MTDGPDPDKDLWSLVARELQESRNRADMSLAQVGNALGLMRTAVHAWERARNKPTEEQAESLDKLYGTTHLKWLVRHARRNRTSDWRKEHAELEQSAAEVWSFELSWLPGLLQTRAYARACFATTFHPRDLDRLADARIARQECLTRAGHPLRLWSIIEHYSLLRHVGGAAVMAEQLDHLMEMAELPNVSVRVVHLEEGEHIGQNGSVKLLRVANPPRKIGYVEASLGGRLVWGEDVEGLEATYTKIGSSALTERKSKDLIRKVRDGLA